MKVQIGQMDEELAKYHKLNTSLDLQINELQSKLRAVEVELNSERELVSGLQTTLKRFRADVHGAVKFIQEPKQLATAIRQVYHNYVQDVSTLAVLMCVIYLIHCLDTRRSA